MQRDYIIVGLVSFTLAIIVGGFMYFGVRNNVPETYVPAIFGAPTTRLERTLLPETNNLYDLGTTSPTARNWRNLYLFKLLFSTTTTGCATYGAGGELVSTGSACGGAGLSGGVAQALTIWTSTTAIAPTTSSPLTVGSITGTTTATSTFAGGMEALQFGATTGTSTLRGLSVISGGLKVPTIASCSEALETNAGGDIICGTDATSAGGAANSKWATSTDATALYPNGSSIKAIVVNGTATSTQGVAGQFYGPVSATQLIATSTATSTSLFGGIQALRVIVNTIEATSTTSSVFTTPITETSLTSALILTGTGGLHAEYTGVTCTNQFLRILDALGAGTCATVGTADVSGLDISDDTNLAVTFPITLTGDTVGFTGLSTTTELTAGQSIYATGKNTLGSVATTTVAAGSGISLSASPGFLVGGSNLTITATLGTSVTLTSEVDGVLPVANGGTNASALSSALLWFNGTLIQATSSQVTVGSLVSTTTATSTFAGGIQTTAIGTTATSTMAGLQIQTQGLKLALNCSATGDLLQTSASGDVICGTDDSAAGGAANSKWSTSTDATALYPNGSSIKALIVNGTATSTQGIAGQFYGPIEFTSFTATSTATSTSLFGGAQILRILVGTIQATSTTATSTIDTLSVARGVFTTFFDAISATTFAIKAAASLTLTQIAGAMGIDTTSGQLRWSDGTDTHIATDFISKTLVMSSTTGPTLLSTDEPFGKFAAGQPATNTYAVYHPTLASTVSSLYCITDQGVALVRIGDGTNFTFHYFAKTAQAASTSLGVNGAFTALEEVRVQIGSATGTIPNSVRCSLEIDTNAD